jgi:hypothetical protein
VHPDDVADQPPQPVHLVHQVEQDRPVARLPPPAPADVEVVVGFAEQGRAHDGDDPAEDATGHDLAGPGHDRAVPAVVPGEQRDAGRLGRLDQPGGALDRVGDRLLHGRRHTRGDALEAAVHVQPVGRGEHDAVGPVALQELGQRPVPRDAVLPGHRVRGGRGVDDRGEAGGAAGGDLLDVPAADEAGTGHGDPHAVGHVASLASEGPVAGPT